MEVAQKRNNLAKSVPNWTKVLHFFYSFDSNLTSGNAVGVVWSERQMSTSKIGKCVLLHEAKNYVKPLKNKQN